MTRLVQLRNGARRAVAVVEEPQLRVLAGVESVYELAVSALSTSTSLADRLEACATDDRIDYDEVYGGRSAWRLLAPIDHPLEPARCLVSGTGLTHLGSAENRNAMHGRSDADLTDSMRMFRAGLAGGRPAAGTIGASPEWFYKGHGDVLRAHGEPLDVPWFSEEGGEEAEVAGVYVVDADGRPRRIGMTAGNEFSDHQLERTNYLNLATSKLRPCAIGPELALDPSFEIVPGRVAIERGGKEMWAKEIATGESEMCHSVANIEHHHFKFDAHRRPGDVHVHFYGAHSLSFADGVRLEEGDVMAIRFAGFGRALRNPIRFDRRPAGPVAVRSL